jgi:orotate phosphoribosyltransferase
VTAVVTDPERVRQLITAEPRPGVAADVTDVLARSGALLAGHFLLKSGEHTPHFLRFAQIGREPELVAIVAHRLIETARVELRASTILCPETAGFFLGSAIAREVGAEIAVARVDVARRRPGTQLRTGDIAPGARVIIVNDVVTSGASITRLVDLARAAGAHVAAAMMFATLDDRRLKRYLNDHDLPGAWLASATWSIVDATSCPQCKAGEELLPVAELG